MQHRISNSWEKWRLSASSFNHYVTYVATKLQNHLVLQTKNCTHEYMQEQSFSAPSYTTASIWGTLGAHVRRNLSNMYNLHCTKQIHECTTFCHSQSHLSLVYPYSQLLHKTTHISLNHNVMYIVIYNVFVKNLNIKNH